LRKEGKEERSIIANFRQCKTKENKEIHGVKKNVDIFEISGKSYVRADLARGRSRKCRRHPSLNVMTAMDGEIYDD
jgi:hypothetical protein